MTKLPPQETTEFFNAFKDLFARVAQFEIETYGAEPSVREQIKESHQNIADMMDRVEGHDSLAKLTSLSAAIPEIRSNDMLTYHISAITFLLLDVINHKELVTLTPRCAILLNKLLALNLRMVIHQLLENGINLNLEMLPITDQETLAKLFTPTMLQEYNRQREGFAKANQTDKTKH